MQISSSHNKAENAKFSTAWIMAVLLLLFAATSEAYGLKIGVYNVHGGVGTDGVTDLPRIARVLKSAVPDVVALNEVNRPFHGGAYNDVELAKELGPEWEATFGKTIDKPFAKY